MSLALWRYNSPGATRAANAGRPPYFSAPGSIISSLTLVICSKRNLFRSTAVRFTALSIGYGLSVTIFGGFAPFVATWLIAETGDPLSPSYYLVATALISAIALMVIEMRTPRG